MRTHREFCQDVVGPMADIVFVGCSMADPAAPLATSTAVEHILGTPSLSDAERAAILGDTACKLLGIAS